ncbi:MAG: phage tail tape measure protein [Devosia sp.]|jgi:tape measure domain-containing protein|nr:phage tail tape measure protein [Devosia sp.]
MTDIASLGLEIRSDGVVVATERLGRLGDTVRKTERATERMTREVQKAERAMAVMTRVVGVLAAAFSVQKLIDYTNAWTDLQSRVEIASGSMGQGMAVMGRLSEMARRTYSSLELTAESYRRNATAMRQLGYSTTQTLDYVEAINNALVVSGAKGERAASVLDALGKAMALGKLFGDQLETVLASGGRVAEALADSLGVTTLELRKLGADGKLTGDVLQSGLTSQLERLRAEADAMPATIGDAFTLLGNSILETVGTFDQASGASGRVAEAIIMLGDNIDMVIPIASGLGTVIAVTLIPNIIAATASFGALTIAMLSNPFVQLALVAGALAAALVYLDQQQRLAASAAETHGQAMTANANAIEVAKTSSQGFRDGLRSQIEMQIAAAKAALDEAGAQYQAAKAYAARAEMFNKVMNLGANLLGMPGEDRNYGDQIMGDALENINATLSRVNDLEGQLEEFDTKMSSAPPAAAVVHSFQASGTAAKAAAKAVKEAEKDFDSFTSTADKLAEKLFPGEYARREAAELTTLLEKYRGSLDSFQVQGVEREIADLNSAADQGLRRLEDRAKKTGDAVTETLGKVLGSLFDGPMDDVDAFFDKAVGAFAQLGEQNLGKFFDGFGSPTAANDNAGGATNIFEAIFQGSKAGTEEGAGKGLFAGLKGLQGLSGMAGAGVGGLGLGMQTQSPVMGALGGAMSGFAAGGPVGALVGGVMGFIGGMMGASKATKEAKEKLDQLRPSIEQFIGSMNGEVVSQYAKAMVDAQRQAEEYIALARKAKDKSLVKEIEAALENLPATLARQYEKDVQASINALQGNGYLNDVAAAQELYNARLKDAEKLGVSADNALVEFNLTLRKIATDGDLTADQLANLLRMFPDLAGAISSVVSIDLGPLQDNVERARSDLRSAYEKEAAAIRQVSDSLKASIRSLQKFKNGLKFDGALSPLDPQQRLLAAQADYEKVAKAALGGDPEAISKLEDVSRQYLEEARTYYASSEQYFAIFEAVNTTLDQALAKAAQQVSAADRQLAALDRQVGHLIDINNSVLSVAQAVRALAQAQSALDAARNFGANPERNRAIDQALRQQGINYQGNYGGGGFEAFRSTLSLAQQQIVADIVGRYMGMGYRLGGVVGAFANGGMVGNGIWDRDSVLARYAGGGAIALAGGEFVNRAPSVNQNTLPVLHHINRTGRAPGNDNREMVAALGRIEGRLASLERTAANAGLANVEATRENTEAVQDTNKAMRMAGARR